VKFQIYSRRYHTC